jgi:hypothetical protein
MTTRQAQSALADAKAKQDAAGEALKNLDRQYFAERARLVRAKERADHAFHAALAQLKETQNPAQFGHFAPPPEISHPTVSVDLEGWASYSVPIDTSTVLGHKPHELPTQEPTCTKMFDEDKPLDAKENNVS